ncbi:hypothetical protein A9Q84_00545 [Halobacteriovorax marinus]|mgnify:CR=1 FL=1|uniref:Phospholipase/carboxylesterase/thioesterase domain-containing protein n=1 Tax=Halobacteriovorax marinus TaxID=97084 RepID=A0A1Y5FBG2_9BACT|nr:hypothetical protein A9Q84_00545 [Halobacteriovorax marinus]
MNILRSIALIITLCFSATIQAKKVELVSLNPARENANLFLPRGYKKAASLPLVISLHGFGGNQNLQNWYLKLKKYTSKAGFMLLIPNGTKNSAGKGFWNASNFCCDFEKSKIDDQAYILGLIEKINNDPKLARVNRSKIFVVGYSNGAFMAHKLACDMNSPISGIVTLSGTTDLRNDAGELIPPELAPCEHNRSIRHLHIHGTNDQTIKYTGFDNGKTGLLSVDQFMKKWSIQNNCRGERVEGRELNTHLQDFGKDAQTYKWSDCDAKLELIKINDGNHFIFYKKKVAKRIINFLLK